MLQYEIAAGIWSEIGKMKARYFHGVVEIDLSLVCSGIVGCWSDKQIVISTDLFTKKDKKVKKDKKKTT